MESGTFDFYGNTPFNRIYHGSPVIPVCSGLV